METLQQKISKFFQNVLEQNFGSSFNSVLNFYFKKKYGCSPYEVLWENPYAFYTTLKEVFGSGGEVVVRVIAENLIRKCSVNLPPDEVIKLIKKGRSKQSKINLQEILKEVAGV
ncbi:MAG: hypothetical protein ACKD6N_00685 [Candidatus Bathyarchaeota archaeon]